MPLLVMLIISALRLPKDSMTAPMFSSGTSIIRRSIGSIFSPSISLMITSGLETCIS
ncbi:hypothetical protein D3C81_1844310 [compost metagenome]